MGCEELCGVCEMCMCLARGGFSGEGVMISAYSWWNCQATHNRLQIEINYYPDSLLFISAGFLPRVSSQRLN